MAKTTRIGCVDVLIRNVPIKLLETFDEEIVKPKYPGGRSEAYRSLMEKAIQAERPVKVN